MSGMKYLCLILIYMRCSFVNGVDSSCDTFTASKCFPSDDTKITDLDDVPEDVCQTFCTITLGCNFYTYEVNKTGTGNPSCSLFTEDYRGTCSVIGADRDANINPCIKKEQVRNTCDEFLNERCAYDKNSIVFKAGDEFMDALKCQQLCIDQKDNLKCKYWTFESETTTNDGLPLCTLYNDYKDVLNTCKAVHGPKVPFHEDCGPI